MKGKVEGWMGAPRLRYLWVGEQSENVQMQDRRNLYGHEMGVKRNSEYAEEKGGKAKLFGNGGNDVKGCVRC